MALARRAVLLGVLALVVAAVASARETHARTGLLFDGSNKSAWIDQSATTTRVRRVSNPNRPRHRSAVSGLQRRRVSADPHRQSSRPARDDAPRQGRWPVLGELRGLPADKLPHCPDAQRLALPRQSRLRSAVEGNPTGIAIHRQRRLPVSTGRIRPGTVADRLADARGPRYSGSDSHGTCGCRRTVSSSSG